MNKPYIFFFILLISNFSIGQTAHKLNYIYDCDEKICEEYLNHDSSEVINFDVDNKIYKENIEFIFTYKYVQDGIEFLIGNQGHSLIGIDSADDQTITEVAFYCSKEDGDLMRKFLPNYKQSGVAYNYYNSNGESFEPKEGSGLKENEMNVWIHPFRRATYFAMLNINPYPYVKYPISIGDDYKWELKVGGNTYTNPIWAEWEGATNRKHHYKVVSKVEKDYPFAKDVQVYHIHATSTSEIGDSSADFWFSKEFGFVEMNYTNINGTKFNFKLDRIISRK